MKNFLLIILVLFVAMNTNSQSISNENTTSISTDMSDKDPSSDSSELFYSLVTDSSKAGTTNSPSTDQSSKLKNNGAYMMIGGGLCVLAGIAIRADANDDASIQDVMFSMGQFAAGTGMIIGGTMCLATGGVLILVGALTRQHK